MFQYCNAYSCASNKNNEEIIVNLIQNAPIIDGNGHVSSTESTTLASVLLRPDLALNLAHALLSLISELPSMQGVLDEE